VSYKSRKLLLGNMAKFFLDSVSKRFEISKTPTLWSVDFELPEAVRDTLSMAEVGRLEGIFLMSFYEPPLVGDRVEYRGFEWEVVSRWHLAHRHQKHDQREVSRLFVKFLGPGKHGETKAYGV
jgi:hypothetical protein